MNGDRVGDEWSGLLCQSARGGSEVGDVMPERDQCLGIGWHGVIVEVALDDTAQPPSLVGNRVVHALPHFLFYHLKLRSHAVAMGLHSDLELTRLRLAADKGKAQQGEGVRRAKPAAACGIPPRSVRTRSTRSSRDAVSAQTSLAARAFHSGSAGVVVPTLHLVGENSR